MAAQEHFSFLRNLEEGRLGIYGGVGGRGDGGRGDAAGGGRDGSGRGREREEKLWDMHGTRIQVNMIAIWGDDVLDHGPVPADDEHYFTVELVERLGRREFHLFLLLFFIPVVASRHFFLSLAGVMMMMMRMRIGANAYYRRGRGSQRHSGAFRLPPPEEGDGGHGSAEEVYGVGGGGGGVWAVICFPPPPPPPPPPCEVAFLRKG